MTVPPNKLLNPSRSYKIALTFALIILFALLTLTILIIIISNAREQTREEEFRETLTAVSAALNQAQSVLTATPTPAPLPLSGDYSFIVSSGSPIYAAAEPCDHQVLVGQVLDQNGVPMDGFQVRVWGDYVRPQVLFTGEIARRAPGQWVLSLDDMNNRRLWVQLEAADRYLSAPVEIILNAANCNQTRVEVIFEQRESLNP